MVSGVVTLSNLFYSGPRPPLPRFPEERGKGQRGEGELREVVVCVCVCGGGYLPPPMLGSEWENEIADFW